MMKTILALMLAAATPAAAHVTLDPSEAQPGAYTRLAFRVGHGCSAGAATTAIEVALPAGMTVARPMPKPGWDIAVEPGASVAWRGGPLPDAWYDEFVMLVRTPDRGGEALAFPVTQRCGDAVAAWTQVAAEGEPRPRFPAPLLQLAQASGAARPGTAAPGAATLGTLRLENGWTRAAGQGAQGGGFVTIRNTGAEADRLVAVSSPAAARVELHTSLREGDIMRMRPVENIPVPAGGSVTLAPGGLHMMLIGLTRPLAVGQTVPVTLRFERAGQVTVNMAVQSAGARGPMPMQGHQH